jgi:hypothetical protein
MLVQDSRVPAEDLHDFPSGAVRDLLCRVNSGSIGDFPLMLSANA